MPFRVGKFRDAVHSVYADMEFIGAAIFRRTLTDAEIEEVSKEFGWRPYTSLLDEAVVAAVAGVYDPAGDRLLDITGREHHFVLGGTASASTNDPLRLPYDGEKYVRLPGTAGNYISTPDSAALDITGDIDIRARADLTIGHPGAVPGLSSTRRTS